MIVEFKGLLKDNNALKINRDGGEFNIEFPETEKADAIKLALMTGKVLKIKIESE